MIPRLVLRGLVTRPVRSAVLAAGFGFGIAVMAALLGVGEVVLAQSRSPWVHGGGDAVVLGAAGRVTSARFVLGHVLSAPPLAESVQVASPSVRTTLYLVRAAGAVPVEVRGGIPSLERALGDPETVPVQAWSDDAADLRWTAPDPADVLRAMDRFHPIPDVPPRASSWAEWLYFNGRSGDGRARFYLTFFTGPTTEAGRRPTGVRLQIELPGRGPRNYSRTGEAPEADVLASAPNLEFAGGRIRLEGRTYHVTLDLEDEQGGAGLAGEILLEAVPGRSVPPLELRGAGGWVAGYVVPVLSGSLTGRLARGAEEIPLQGWSGYHDHNWGFWRDVAWQWGQVAHEGLSFLYGRIRPPADAADPERIPGLFAVFGPEGPIAFTRGVQIEEHDLLDGSRPASIRVRAHGPGVDVTLDLAVEGAVRTRVEGPMAQSTQAMDFLQMRARYTVSGTLAGTPVAFTEHGHAETWRGRY